MVIYGGVSVVANKESSEIVLRLETRTAPAVGTGESACFVGLRTFDIGVAANAGP